MPCRVATRSRREWTPRGATLCREAAEEDYDLVVAFGGDGAGQRGGQRPGALRHPAHLPAGRRDNVYCKMLGVPGDIVNAHRRFLRLADEWAPPQVDSPT